jgi:hypothetical protein
MGETMSNSSFKLAELVDRYTVFEENQVLAAAHLNSLAEYLDRQDRLSRVKLFGVGNVCGLEVGYGGSTVTLTKGCAVTSDGDLLQVDKSQTFQHFRPFLDDEAEYPFFRTAGGQVPLFELFTAKEADTTPLANFKAVTGKSLEDMAVVLYLESYVFDPDICTGGDCDNKGKEQRNNLRILLVDRSDLDALMKASPLPQTLFPFLGDLSVERVLLDPGGITNYAQLAERYRGVIKALFDKLNTALKKTYSDDFRSLLADLYGGADPTITWESRLKQIVGQVNTEGTGIQYVYDFLCDVAATYQEFKETLFADNVLCSPDLALFPKHTLLGSVAPKAPAAEGPYRYGFYESPLLNLKSHNLNRARHLHKRMDGLIRAFQLPSPTATLRVTPSRKNGSGLGEKAIPYYFRLDSQPPLNQTWSYEASLRSRNDAILSYNADQYSARSEVREPLKFSISSHDFFRIEGHMGRDVDEAEQKIEDEIKKYNLPFRVLTLQMDSGIPPIRVRPGFWFKDLKVLHYLHRKDLAQNFKQVKTFGARLKTEIDKSPDLPDRDVKDTKISVKSVVDANRQSMDTAIDAATTALKQKYKEFNYKSFETTYINAIQQASALNKGIKGVTYSSAFTPFEKVVNDTRFRWLEWIDAILKKRKEKTEELSLFTNFLADCPSMEHLGGVERGGTFILVFSATTKKVVADFSLPYWYVDLPKDDEPEEEEVEEDEKIDWFGVNDFLVSVSKEKLLEDKFDKLKGTFDGVDVRLKAQEESLKVYSGSLKTYTETIMKVAPAKVDVGYDPGMYTDKDLGMKAGVLRYTTEYIDAVEEKVKAGKATREEIEMKDQLEETSSELIKKTLEGFGKKESDLVLGSEEEKFIQIAASSAEKFTNTAVKENLTVEVRKMQETAADKTMLSNQLNRFIKR